MNIGGLQRFSLIDYPGKVSAILFMQSCNFRCGYCHNPELVLPEKFRERISEEDVFRFLESRKGRLDAVVVTGGEPTLQFDLIPFLQKVRDIGYLIKLDSNGSRPDVLEKIIGLGLADYLAMDLKAPLCKYDAVAAAAVDVGNIRKSIKLIMNSGVAYEFRTTVVRSQLSREDLLAMGNEIKGARMYALHGFSAKSVLDQRFLNESAYTREEMRGICSEIESSSVERCIVR